MTFLLLNSLLSQDDLGPLPSLEDVQQSRGAWDRLGLYMKGTPKKSSKDSEANKSLDDLTIAASNIMLTLKADQESYDIRYETQV